MQDFGYNPFEPDNKTEREEKPRRHLLSGFGKDPQDDVDWAEQQDPEGEAAERKKDLRIVIVWAVIVMALLAVLILYLQLRKTRISLNDYLQIETEGYESIGEAAYRFDANAFIQDYKEILRYRGGKPNTRAGDYANAAEALLNTCVKGELTRTDGLSNGDMVTFSWDCDDARAAADYHCVLVYSNIDITVEDLAEPDLFDPFAGVTVEFNGTSPEGTASVHLISGEAVYQDLSYSLDKTDHLQNGDTVRVSVKRAGGGDIAENTLREYGMVPSVLERDYVVDGLTTYAARLEEIPDDAMQEMRMKSEEVFLEQEVPGWKEGAELLNREYLGSYLLVTEENAVQQSREEDSDPIQEIVEQMLPSGVGVVQKAVSGEESAPSAFPFGWGGNDDGQEGEEEKEDTGFHWSDLLDPSFYGIGSGDGEDGEDSGGSWWQSGNSGNHDNGNDSGSSPQETVPTPTPEPEEESWYGLEDILHTSDYEDDRQNILYLVYKVDVSLRGSSTFSYYTYTAFSDIQILADGSADVDLELWHVPTGSSFLGTVSGDLVSVRQGLRTYYFSGFETLNDLYRRCIYAQKDSYSCESSIEG